MNWKVDESKPHRYDHITNEMGDYVAVIYTSADDARLIAAAPDLLEACKVTLAELERHSPLTCNGCSYSKTLLLCAIAKAEEKKQ